MNPPHPDDVAAVRHLMTCLRGRREAVGLKQGDLATAAGLSKTHVGDLERNPTMRVGLSVLHRIAAGLGLGLRYHLDGLPDPPMECRTSAVYLAMWDQTGDPVHLSIRLVARIAAARKWLGVETAETAAHLGISQSAVHVIERPDGDVQAATAFGLCRALGGRLDIAVTDAV